jgi:Zn-dependent protease
MPTCYEIDSSHVSLKEYWWGTKNPIALLLGVVLKFCRIRIPGSSDDPNVDSTLSCITESLPDGISEKFAVIIGELANLGFYDPVFHFIEDLGTQTRIYWATLRHTSGHYCARVHHRYWGKAQNHDRGTFPVFFTEFADETFLVSSSGKPDVAEPPTVQMQRMPQAPLAKLWTEHTRKVESLSTTKPIRSVATREDIISATERLHLLQRNFHLARGFFRERTLVEQTKTNEFSATVANARASGVENAEVMAELTRLQTQKPTWTSGLWILALSCVGFLAAGAAQWSWKTTIWLVPILLFHELGHWLAMRLFGYRNLRMFFIPFFGAAVTGKNWNVSGWKKAFVALAGPLPGIFLGIVLGILAIIWNIQALKQAALMLILLNGFNLLPVLPLDGGHFLHCTLFCRNRWLDITFRTLAVIALLASAAFGSGRVLMYVGIALAVGLPVAFKMAKVTDRFRHEPLPAPAPSDDQIPVETAKVLIAAVKSELPKNASNKVLAQHTLNVFETLNARPPNIWATLGLLSLYGGTLVVALIFSMLLVISREGRLGDLCAPQRISRNTPLHVRQHVRGAEVLPNLRNRKTSL